MSLVRYRTNDYSVPVEWGHREVLVKGFVHEVVICAASEAPAARLDMVAPNPQSVVRASPHYYNTEDELARLTGVVRSLSGAPA